MPWATQIVCSEEQKSEAKGVVTKRMGTQAVRVSLSSVATLWGEKGVGRQWSMTRPWGHSEGCSRAWGQAGSHYKKESSQKLLLSSSLSSFHSSSSHLTLHTSTLPHFHASTHSPTHLNYHTRPTSSFTLELHLRFRPTLSLQTQVSTTTPHQDDSSRRGTQGKHQGPPR